MDAAGTIEEGAERQSPPAALLGEVISISGCRLIGVITVEPPHNNDGADRWVQVGGLVRIPTPASDAYGIVESMRVDFHVGGKRRLADIQLIGEVIRHPGAGRHPKFERGVSSYPALEGPIFDTTRKDLELVYARPDATTARIGSLFQDHAIPSFIMTDELLSKHFAILGTTGCGKSCTVALILRAILKEHPSGHIVMLDPHDEYSQAFRDQAEVIRPADLELPYWLFNLEESIAVMTKATSDTYDRECAILKDGLIDARTRYLSTSRTRHRVSVDTPAPYRLSDLIRYIDSQMGQLNRPENSVPYLRLKSRIESLSSDVRLGFMFPGHVVEDNFKAILSRLLRIPVAGKPVTVLDISGMPAEIVDVVVSLICRLVFDYALWSDREDASPILLVCEEAHRYAPESADIGFQPTKRALARIAKEGRKYGISLCLVSQRPSELSMSILSQCNTLFALRMANEGDHEFVGHALPESAQAFLASLPALRTQEAIVMGEGVTVPMRVYFDDLAPEHRPRSNSQLFSERWAERQGDSDAFLDDTIDRWRSNQRPTKTGLDPAKGLRTIVSDRAKSALEGIEG